MTLPSRNSICKVEIIENHDPFLPKLRSYDKVTLSVLLFTLLLTVGSISYILYQAHHHHQIEAHMTGDEFRKLVQEIFAENDDVLKSGSVVIEVQIFDKNHNLLWFKPVESLKDEENVENEIVDEFEERENDIMPFSVRPSVRRSRSVDASYIISHRAQFVNCDHFKPIPRGKYLVPPSLSALHACYQYGVNTDELNRGIFKRPEGSEFRYNLQDIYVACHDVFNDQMDELTSELRNDYDRCKWSGALDENQQKAVEERFAPYFTPSNTPSNLEVNPSSYPATTLLPTLPATTQTSARIDPRAYVECSHVEIEMFEDSFESPSPEALQRCHKFGVTYDELRRGISQNPHPEQTRLDVGNLYVSCRDVFDGNLEYLTNELKEDYRKCKRMRALSRETLAKVERKFYEALYDEREATSRRPTTVTTSSTASDDKIERETTTVTNLPSSFANCKRVENKDYYICIKVISTATTTTTKTTQPS